ncbi:hypothetical protein DPMN_096958 [Dreissena polymorpha]|uniref:Uncharacterized protein n=1 Tax=Dreissena polymorpha TaxID=45954 RepID=A0A9D4R447_DREPO|nr:hypothetical protein DPMN_096958 [Dreissena polymorpha]
MADADAILKAAQNEISQVMNSAMGNISAQAGSEKSEFSKTPVSHDVVYEEQVDYVEPMQDPYSKAIKYLENHNIMQLFQHLTAGIVYNKPEKPLEYMMQEVQRMKDQLDKEKASAKK